MKLKNTKSNLKLWNHTHFGHIKVQISNIKQQISEASTQTDFFASQQYKNLVQELQEWYHREEQFFWQ